MAKYTTKCYHGCLSQPNHCWLAHWHWHPTKSSAIHLMTCVHITLGTVFVWARGKDFLWLIFWHIFKADGWAQKYAKKQWMWNSWEEDILKNNILGIIWEKMEINKFCIRGIVKRAKTLAKGSNCAVNLFRQKISFSRRWLQLLRGISYGSSHKYVYRVYLIVIVLSLLFIVVHFVLLSILNKRTIISNCPDSICFV
jgi:hypothetical protein